MEGSHTDVSNIKLYYTVWLQGVSVCVGRVCLFTDYIGLQRTIVQIQSINILKHLNHF